MKTEPFIYLICGITLLVSIANDIFNFLPIKPDKPDGWNNLFLAIWGLSFLYFLVKTATKKAVIEALEERNDL